MTMSQESGALPGRSWHDFSVIEGSLRSEGWGYLEADTKKGNEKMAEQCHPVDLVSVINQREAVRQAWCSHRSRLSKCPALGPMTELESYSFPACTVAPKSVQSLLSLEGSCPRV